MAALQTKQVDAIVVDTPDGQYMATSEVQKGVQVGQFPSTGEHYGLLFRKGNPLVACVDSALTVMGRNGDAGQPLEEVPRYLQLHPAPKAVGARDDARSRIGGGAARTGPSSRCGRPAPPATRRRSRFTRAIALACAAGRARQPAPFPRC